MTAVLAVEIRRALARRLVRVLVLVTMLVIVVTALGAFLSSDPDSLDAFSPADIWSTDLDATADAQILAVMALLYLLVGLLAGASLVGAEYRAGTITALLTWEPRRLRVVAAKLLAAGLLAAGLFLLLQGLLGAALAPAAVVRGTTEGADGDFYRGLAGFLARGALVTGGCAVLGASIAALGRNTTAAMTAVLAYLIVIEQVLGGLRPSWRAWFVSENLFIVLFGQENVGRSVPAATLVLMAYLAAAVVGATLVFLRRDVT